MFEVMQEAFDGTTIAGFCVAGGSTKGDLPPAMEDDTQHAVRQGIRHRARERWGYDVCFWEMGAKLMLQPKVGRLWGHTQAERDAARELFRLNAEDMAREVTIRPIELHTARLGPTGRLRLPTNPKWLADPLNVKPPGGRAGQEVKR